MEKRALSIILPEEDYQSAVQNLRTLHQFKNVMNICAIDYLQSAFSNPNHKLANPPPPRFEAGHNLRIGRKFAIQRILISQIDRHAISFMPCSHV